MGLLQRLLGIKSKLEKESESIEAKLVELDKNDKPVPKNKQEIDLSKEQANKTLSLRKETLSISLKKRNLDNTRARVAVVMDKSGSMQSLYNKGVVQEVLERILPIAIKFDDDGELDIWIFSTRMKRLAGITEKDFSGYVDREILNNRSNDFWGGTNYADSIDDVVRKYTIEEPSDIPSYVIFITDGENSDRTKAIQAITNASKHNIFWQFVGIGNEDFKFLKELDEMEGRAVDNANFFEIKDLKKISDEDLYDKLLTEYPYWERDAKRLGIIKS